MQYAKYWGAIASHSGDAYFDFVYMHDWPNAITELMKHRNVKRAPGVIKVGKEEAGVALGRDDGRIKNFLDSVWKKEKLSESEGHTLMMMAMALLT